MGGPGETDTHPLHGELPNAPFKNVFLELGEDNKGRYIGYGWLLSAHGLPLAIITLAKPLCQNL